MIPEFQFLQAFPYHTHSRQHSSTSPDSYIIMIDPHHELKVTPAQASTQKFLRKVTKDGPFYP